MLQPSTVHNLAQQLHSLERERQTLQRKLDESLTKRTLLTALNHQLSNDDEIIRNGLVRKLQLYCNSLQPTTSKEIFDSSQTVDELLRAMTARELASDNDPDLNQSSPRFVAKELLCFLIKAHRQDAQKLTHSNNHEASSTTTRLTSLSLVLRTLRARCSSIAREAFETNRKAMEILENVDVEKEGGDNLEAEQEMIGLRAAVAHLRSFVSTLSSITAEDVTTETTTATETTTTTEITTATKTTTAANSKIMSRRVVFGEAGDEIGEREKEKERKEREAFCLKNKMLAARCVKMAASSPMGDASAASALSCVCNQLSGYINDMQKEIKVVYQENRLNCRWCFQVGGDSSSGMGDKAGRRKMNSKKKQSDSRRRTSKRRRIVQDKESDSMQAAALLSSLNLDVHIRSVVKVCHDFDESIDEMLSLRERGEVGRAVASTRVVRREMSVRAKKDMVDQIESRRVLLMKLLEGSRLEGAEDQLESFRMVVDREKKASRDARDLA